MITPMTAGLTLATMVSFSLNQKTSAFGAIRAPFATPGRKISSCHTLRKATKMPLRMLSDEASRSGVGQYRLSIGAFTFSMTHAGTIRVEVQSSRVEAQSKVFYFPKKLNLEHLEKVESASRSNGPDFSKTFTSASSKDFDYMMARIDHDTIKLMWDLDKAQLSAITQEEDSEYFNSLELPRSSFSRLIDFIYYGQPLPRLMQNARISPVEGALLNEPNSFA